MFKTTCQIAVVLGLCQTAFAGSVKVNLFDLESRGLSGTEVVVVVQDAEGNPFDVISGGERGAVLSVDSGSVTFQIDSRLLPDDDKSFRMVFSRADRVQTRVVEGILSSVASQELNITVPEPPKARCTSQPCRECRRRKCCCVPHINVVSSSSLCARYRKPLRLRICCK